MDNIKLILKKQGVIVWPNIYIYIYIYMAKDGDQQSVLVNIVINPLALELDI